jgi:hypothetical protein
MPQVPPDQLQHVSDRATADIATVVLGVALALVPTDTMLSDWTPWFAGGGSDFTGYFC